ncbi:MAG: hypothetical protein E3J52_05455 [Promethearchaeota archaeon]|nr:MAG: hypothetical protein E3J52_05455 [Candidatus Lokiarchaeota archaeon]
MPKIRNVLFLCAGNTCRSPFASEFAKFLKNTKYRNELREVEFDSAGLYHYYEVAQDGTVNYLKSKGVDISNFRTKRVNEDLVSKQDIILAFEQKRHINKLKRRFKNLSLDEKVFLLLEYAGDKENLEIEDPFYLEQEEYNKILKRIEEGVLKAIDKIIKINNLENN